MQLKEIATYVMASVVALFSSAITYAQEKMAAYPNLSFQGTIPNPARTQFLGDFAYFGGSAGNGTKSFGMEISKDFGGLHGLGALYSGGAWSLTLGTRLNDELAVGGMVTSGNKQGIAGLLYTARHDSSNLTQFAGQYDLLADAARFAAEVRQRLGENTYTISGQITGGKKDDGKTGIIDKGVGIQFETPGQARFSAGFGGKSWKDISLAAQIKRGNFLPEAGIRVPNGRLKAARVWLGVTALLPRR